MPPTLNSDSTAKPGKSERVPVPGAPKPRKSRHRVLLEEREAKPDVPDYDLVYTGHKRGWSPRTGGRYKLGADGKPKLVEGSRTEGGVPVRRRHRKR